MTLDQLNEAKPVNSDAISFGDNEIRDTRLAVLTTFGVEHNLDGSHRFPVGNTAGRPQNSSNGRLYINTERKRIEVAFEGVWYSTPAPRYVPVNITTGGNIFLYGGALATITIMLRHSGGAFVVIPSPKVAPNTTASGTAAMTVSYAGVTSLSISGFGTPVTAVGMVMIL